MVTHNPVGLRFIYEIGREITKKYDFNGIFFATCSLKTTF